MSDIFDQRRKQTEKLIQEMTGPTVEGCGVFIDGRKVPNLLMLDRVEGEVTFILDGRLSFSFPRDVAVQAASFAASAMAIGAGYGSIAQCDEKPPFAPKVVQIGGGE